MRTDGIVLLDKPAGTTSFTTLGALKRELETGRIGHTGTLDKFATGLLVALTGRFTKLADLFSALDKCYEATIVLGETTDTLDPEGRIVEQGPLPRLRSIEQAAKELTGTIEQLPPDYSAVHVGGERAYRIARSGGNPRLQPRRVTIHSLEVLDHRGAELDIAVRCSKGTYIRALARDLGRAAGSCAYVRRLRRTEVGPYTVEEALAPDRFPGPDALENSLERLSRLDSIGILPVKREYETAIRQGQTLRERFFSEAPGRERIFAVLDSCGCLMAVAVREGSDYRYKMVL